MDNRTAHLDLKEKEIVTWYRVNCAFVTAVVTFLLG